MGQFEAALRGVLKWVEMARLDSGVGCNHDPITFSRISPSCPAKARPTLSAA